MKTQTVKIGEKVFKSFEEYERAYAKEWERVHPLLSPDINWAKKDWETRILNPAPETEPEIEKLKKHAEEAYKQWSRDYAKKGTQLELLLI